MLLSVVIPTYNRGALLRRLLEQLAEQTLAADCFEVVAVDDGSREPAAAALAGFSPAYRFKLEVVENGGAAAARHRGAELARGEILVFVDDDMQVPADFLEQHAKLHAADAPHTRGPGTVVFGQIRPDPKLEQMPLFERYHARMLERYAAGVRAGRVAPRGTDLCTGNVSLRRSDYLAVGGFDRSFERSEDAELGVRLELHGCRLVFSEAPYTLHGSDHTALETWRGRAFRYGIHDLRVSRKHPRVLSANPFRFLGEVHALSRPFLGSALAAPRATALVGKLAMQLALAADRLGAEGLAIRGTTLVYGIEYFRGLRQEEGSAVAVLRDGLAYLWRARGEGAPLGRLAAEIAEDHATLRRYEAKYHGKHVPKAQLARDLAQRIGFQMLAAYRLMRAFRRAGALTAAKVVSRLIRHAYGADIHWDADFAPGVLIVHGMGMAVSHSAKVGPGCILNHHVTLGEGIDAETRRTGAPALGADVHVGPGATLLGPISVGDQSKIMPGAVLQQSVPPRSLVAVAAPEIRARDAKAIEPSDDSAEAEPS